MADEKQSRAAVAGTLEDGAAKILAALTDEAGEPTRMVNALPIAQVMATLALGQRVADLTDRLGEYLGDDSNLDRLQQALYDPTSAKPLAEILLGHLPGRQS